MPQAAAQRVGEKVTVEFLVASTGTNPAGFLELYSGKTWQEEGSFIIRFCEASQQKFCKLGIPDVRTHFQGQVIRVTGAAEADVIRAKGEAEAAAGSGGECGGETKGIAGAGGGVSGVNGRGWRGLCCTACG